jgi:hypothetical protein
MSRRRKTPTPPNLSHDLRQHVLGYFETLRVPLSAADLDAAMAQAEKERQTPLELLAGLLGPQADLRRQRAIERRIREARFREPVSLELFDSFILPPLSQSLSDLILSFHVLRSV